MTDFSYLHADRVAKANPNLAAPEIRSMSMADFNKLMGREPFRPTLAVQAPGPGPAPQAETPREEIPEPEPVSVKDMTPEQYAAFRQTIGMGQSHNEGIGIFNQAAGSQSEAYRAAATKQAGRNAMVRGNVIPSPSISMDGRFEDRTSRLDNRSAVQRFSTPGNSFQG